MKDWQRIRFERTDITDYVIHLTKDGGDPYQSAKKRLIKILKGGYIEPTFAPLANRYSTKARPTIKGPWPVVCLTEQPLWAIVKMEQMQLWKKRYSGYGIAYHKAYLHACGGRPVFYGDERMLGQRAPKDHKKFREDRDIFIDGLHEDYQYLWTLYCPGFIDDDDPPIDFTWEREWRYRVKVVEDDDRPGLEVPLRQGGKHGAIIVRYDDDVPEIRKLIQKFAAKNEKLLKLVDRIVSLETVEQKIEDGHEEYGRLDTWPDFGS